MTTAVGYSMVVVCLFCCVVDCLELFPNNNLRRFDNLTVITLCRRPTIENDCKQTTDDSLLVEVCNNNNNCL